MERKRLFEPGHFVVSFSGELGLVLSEEALQKARVQMKEGGRAGRFFAPGCCTNPDYVMQIPVLFEDGTYDVMRAMNLRRGKDVSETRRGALEKKMAAVFVKHR